MDMLLLKRKVYEEGDRQSCRANAKLNLKKQLKQLVIHKEMKRS